MLDETRAAQFRRFVRSRHDIWEARQAGAPPPWTDEPILATRKFTNVFRWLDPGSQFVITDLIEPGLPPEEMVFRAVLYRHTGALPAWRYLREAIGRYPLHEDLKDVLEAFEVYAELVGPSVYTNAYTIYPQSSVRGESKLRNVLRMIDTLWQNGSMVDVVKEASWAGKFAALRRNKGVGDFMAMQALTDYGYSTTYREDEFVVAGPGARRGAAALGLQVDDAIEWAVESVRSLPRPPSVAGRLPSKMDLQNCLCEFSKWVRYAAKPLPPEPYRPAHPGPQPVPVLPKLWS